MGAIEVEAFLTYLAVERKVAASTQNQALSAILFLYREVLGKTVETGFQYIGAKRPKRLPVVLTKSEIQQILIRLSGGTKLIVQLLYGSGLRVNEAVRMMGGIVLGAPRLGWSMARTPDSWLGFLLARWLA